MANPSYTAEEWRAIGHTPGYEVSSLGRVRRSLPGTGTYVGKVLKPVKGKRYLTVALSAYGKPVTRTIHVLVAEAFCGPKPSPTHHAAHRDGNALNNCADNIRWATPTENQFDAQQHGTVWSKLSADQVAEIVASSDKPMVLAERYGLHPSTVYRIRKRQTWRGL